MKLDPKDFRVREGDKVNLGKWPTKIEPVCKSKDEYKGLLEDHVAGLGAMQELHYAANSHAVLRILQGTDASGKDGAASHAMSSINPQGCRVYQPSLV
jgi:polyphosphate kinase 2 (PPK2 family)